MAFKYIMYNIIERFCCDQVEMKYTWSVTVPNLVFQMNLEDSKRREGKRNSQNCKYERISPDQPTDLVK